MSSKRPTEPIDTDGSHAPAWEPASARSSGVPTLERGNDQTRVPKLRFPESRDAKGWHATPLGELGEIVTGKTPSTKEEDLWGGEILFITPTDITEGEKYQHTTQRTVVQTTGTKVLPSGSVVYTCIASIGKMSLTVVPSVTNQQINAVVPNGKTAREFLYYSLANLTPWIKSIPATSTLPIINKTQFSGFIIPHPEDKAEQQKIAECLSSVDALMAAQARKVDALKTHKKGLMQQLFPKEGETQPRLRFPEFQNDGEWALTTIGDLKPFVTSGSRGWAPFYAEQGELFVRITNLWRDSIYLDLTDSKFVQLPPGSNEGVRTQLKEHDVLISITADIGIIGYVDESVPSPAYINQHIALVRFDVRQLCGKYVAYFLASEKSQSLFRASTDTGTKAGMSLIGIQKIELMLPGLPEQHRIASCLSSLDTLITLETQKLAALKTHKQGLMQQLFPSPEAVEA